MRGPETNTFDFHCFLMYVMSASGGTHIRAGEGRVLGYLAVIIAIFYECSPDALQQPYYALLDRVIIFIIPAVMGN